MRVPPPLLFIGIHNTWDNVTYVVVDQFAAAGRGAGGVPPR
jgi:hypothetical protein